jgi:WD40 repeat protein
MMATMPLWLALVFVTIDVASKGENLMTVPPLQKMGPMAISPDGKLLATRRFTGLWDKPGVLQVWTVPQGTLLWTAKQPVERLVAFSPDSAVLAVEAGIRRVAFWDTHTGRLKCELHLRQGRVCEGAFLPDGQTFIIALVHSVLPSSGALELWNVKTGRLLRSLRAQTNVVSALGVSPDGKAVAVASEDPGSTGTANRVNIIDISTDSIRYSLSFSTNVWRISSLAFSPDGKTLVGAGGLDTGNTSEIRFWDVATGDLEKMLTQADFGALQPLSMEPELSFSPDGRMLAILGKQCALLVDSSTGKWKLAFGPEYPGPPDSPPDDQNWTVRLFPKRLLRAKVNHLDQVEVDSIPYGEK